MLDTRTVSIHLDGFQWEALREVMLRTIASPAATDDAVALDIRAEMEAFAYGEYEGFPLVLPVYVARAFVSALSDADASATDADPLPMHADVVQIAIEDALARMDEAKRSDADAPTRDDLIAALRALAEYAGGSDSGADHPCGRAWHLLDRIDAQGSEK